jgi:hypothetical protein
VSPSPCQRAKLAGLDSLAPRTPSVTIMSGWFGELLAKTRRKKRTDQRSRDQAGPPSLQRSSHFRLGQYNLRTPSMSPWQASTFEAANRAQGLDWPPHSPYHGRTGATGHLRDPTQLLIDQNIPGDVIETGVWRGGCHILMKGMLRSKLGMNRTVFGPPE